MSDLGIVSIPIAVLHRRIMIETYLFGRAESPHAVGHYTDQTKADSGIALPVVRTGPPTAYSM